MVIKYEIILKFDDVLKDLISIVELFIKMIFVVLIKIFFMFEI